jgi:hypothetical protein
MQRWPLSTEAGTDLPGPQDGSECCVVQDYILDEWPLAPVVTAGGVPSAFLRAQVNEVERSASAKESEPDPSGRKGFPYRSCL